MPTAFLVVRYKPSKARLRTVNTPMEVLLSSASVLAIPDKGIHPDLFVDVDEFDYSSGRDVSGSHHRRRDEYN
jgi:hypothetical protein